MFPSLAPYIYEATSWEEWERRVALQSVIAVHEVHPLQIEQSLMPYNTFLNGGNFSDSFDMRKNQVTLPSTTDVCTYV